MKRTAAPRFADPEHPARTGYTKISMPTGLSPRATTHNVHSAAKPLKPGAPKRPAVDKMASMPSKNAPEQDILRGIGSRRVKY